MQSNFRERHTLRWLAQALFGAWALLLVAMLVGSKAQAQLPQPSQSAQRSQSSAVGEAGPALTPVAGGRIAFVRIVTDTGGIYTMNSDGNDVRQLTSNSQDVAPAWSRDGSKIAFSRPDTNIHHIYVMNADGTDQHSITSGLDSDFFPSWSPDGTKIAFSRAATGNFSEIFVMNSDGSNAHGLTTDQTASNYPSWSPDGTRIVFENCTRDGDTNCEIYVMNANGTNQQLFHDFSNGSAGQPEWSPDGLKIAFSGYDTGLVGNFIYTKNANGSGLFQVTHHADQSVHLLPTWSPDSLWIAYADFDDVTYWPQIYLIDADGTNAQNLTNDLDIFDSYPNWGPAPVIVVKDEDGQPVEGAQVYSLDIEQFADSTCTPIGTTGISGTLLLTSTPALNTRFMARKQIYEGATNKGSHDGWAYHVWLTNITQNPGGFESSYIVTDTTLLTHTLVVAPNQAQIGFNIVASVEYNATPDELAVIAAGLGGTLGEAGGYNVGATDYLMDVTDGQMYFEKITIYEDKQHWADADYAFFAHYPRAAANTRLDGRSALTGTCCNIYAQGSGSYGRPWNQRSSLSTLIHEFGHYAMGAYDEYFYIEDGDESDCTLNLDPSLESRASIMDFHATRSEFCTDDNHNEETQQQLQQGESVWKTVVDNWSDPGGDWTIQSPLDRGLEVLKGPNTLLCREIESAIPVINTVATPSCSPILVKVTLGGNPVADAPVSLDHGGRVISQGVTDARGQARIYGAVVGQDTIRARLVDSPDALLSGFANVSSCGAITIPLIITLTGPEADRPNGQWPLYSLTATPDFSQNQVHAVLHFATDPPAQPTLYASQGGTDRQQITLTYDPVGHNYTGDYAFNPNRSLDFQFDVGLTGDEGEMFFPYLFNAAQFHTSGPADSPTVPTDWDLFPPETMTNLSVDTNSMPDGTGLMGGHVDLPAAPPNGLLAVGGPYAVQGQNPITGSVQLSLEFQSEYFCGLVSGSTSIYRYNGTGWDALSTSLNEEWHLAAADITQWGIYAVFAQPNPQVAFSDVPVGSTFHEYISWMSCHDIINGYQDGTFRPSNNATRGQISKMIALTYGWYLEPNVFWDYVFTDVQPGSTFFLFVEAAYREGVVSGYPCGGPSEPCDPQNRPYFRPSNNVTRGQIAKVIANGSKFTDPVSGQTFEDVPAGSTFLEFVERMASRAIINGYACGGTGEPCVPPNNRPYFRPSNNATRGQLSKMIYLATQPR